MRSFKNLIKTALNEGDVVSLNDFRKVPEWKFTPGADRSKVEGDVHTLDMHITPDHIADKFPWHSENGPEAHPYHFDLEHSEDGKYSEAHTITHIPSDKKFTIYNKKDMYLDPSAKSGISEHEVMRVRTQDHNDQPLLEKLKTYLNS